MLKRFWIDSKKKEQIKKKHKAEFIAFLEKKYGKEYYNKVISESEFERDVDEFETYIEGKNSTNVNKKAKKILFWRILRLNDIEFIVDDNDTVNLSFILDNKSKRVVIDKFGHFRLDKKVVKEWKTEKFWQERKTKNKQKEYDFDFFLIDKQFGYFRLDKEVVKEWKKIEKFWQERKAKNKRKEYDFDLFLKEKYGKASQIIISEAEKNNDFYDEDIEDFEKHKLKPKRAPKRVWLISNGKVNESPVFEEDDEEEYEDGFSFEQLSKKDKEIILKAWKESFNGRKTILLNPHKDDIKNIKILIAHKRKFLHKLNNLLNKNKKKNLMLISEFEDSIKFRKKQLKEAIKKAAQKTKNKNLQKYKLKPKRGRKTRFWLV